ncbi:MULTISPECIES: DNA cytosine methyltransferase [unclassified Pseudomonas]|uniref:DNA cytosine methyltransferase n=1 Tax=unclassified Pseudomonas TaxID=196821 RepID=UPI000B856326|nr:MULTISPECIES: DNA cytosine methyltransferase [unclassified Pseudomonas]
MIQTSPPLQYASVCSGIEAVTVAWKPLGLTPAWFSEIAPFPCAVLAHHYPAVPNLGDMKRLARRALDRTIAAPAILIGGTPCQAFSVAGFRAGLADARGALTLTFVELANAIDQVRIQRKEPEAIIVWENVLGVLNDRGNAFGCFLAALAGEEHELVPPRKTWSHSGVVFGPQRTVAWRVLDAQYFGLAQRRRRVFLVASARVGFDPAAVLFERQGPRRDTAPHRTLQTQAATPAGAGLATLSAPLRAVAFSNAYGMANGQGGAEAALECCPTLTCNHDVAIVVCGTAHGPVCDTSIPHLLHQNVIACNSCHARPTARRLLPIECERLQGLPDNYTRIPRRHYAIRRISHRRPLDMWEVTDNGWMLMAADGPRYKVIGNSMAVPCLTWLGKRLLDVLRNPESFSEVLITDRPAKKNHS